MFATTQERRVRIVREGHDRALLRIPEEFDFEGDEATIRRERDGTLTIVPDRRLMTPAELVAWLRAAPPLPPGEDIETIDDRPPAPVDLGEEP